MGIRLSIVTLTRFVTQICSAIAIVALLSAPAEAQSNDWKARWDQTVAAAKKEGEINISGPSGRGWREYLMKFQEAYPEITVKITPSAGRSFWPRVMKEYEVGQYLWDLRIGGTDNLSYKLKGQGFLDSVRDELILPEVTDEKNWAGGMNTVFVDKEKKYYLAFVLYEQTIAQYNKKVIPGDLTFLDVLDPKWSGKITMAEPHGGSPLSGGSVLYKVYGEDYMRKLIVDQKLVISKEPRQQIQWLFSGRYPITFGLPTAAVVEYNKARGSDSQDDLGRIKGPQTYSHGVGAISLPAKRPHPNAATVFINWLLTKDVQTGLMQAVKLNSRRLDVPPADPDSAVDTSRINEYFASQAEEMQDYQDKTAELFRTLIK